MRLATFFILRPQLVHQGTKKSKFVRAIGPNRIFNLPSNKPKLVESTTLQALNNPKPIPNYTTLENSNAVAELAFGPDLMKLVKTKDNLCKGMPLPNEVIKFASSDIDMEKVNVTRISSKMSSQPTNNIQCPATCYNGNSKGNNNGKSLGLKLVLRSFAFMGKTVLATTAVLLTIQMGVWRGPMHPTKTTLQTVKEDTLNMLDEMLCLKMP